MKVKVLRPCIVGDVGAIVVVRNLGVAKTLVSFGHVEEVKDEPKLDTDENVKPKRASRKPRGSKKSS